MRKPGKPGRPISSEGEQIYSRWVEMGMPSPSKNALAQAFYGGLFTKASGTDRRMLRDKCRQAVDRCLERRIADLQRELAKVRKETAQLREQIAQSERELAKRKAAEP
jgi:septal ring factor EnvC (AmiA/AmiB activator)